MMYEIMSTFFRKWTKVETIVAVTDPVHDVAFAPNLGRSYHLLAIASKELKIISLTPLGYYSFGVFTLSVLLRTIHILIYIDGYVFEKSLFYMN